MCVYAAVVRCQARVKIWYGVSDQYDDKGVGCQCSVKTRVIECQEWIT